MFGAIMFFISEYYEPAKTRKEYLELLFLYIIMAPFTIFLVYNIFSRKSKWYNEKL